jgi:NAD(P)H-dependent flavin oxidoreductase YrpB (nitropropane dioxygenase family)
MDTSKLVPLGIALGICYAVQHFVKNQAVKAAAIGVAGVIVAKQIPYVQDAL